jgi:hypothetical protein
VHRATVLVTHFFAFSIVAPRPLLTGPPDTMTTFMWEEKNRLAHYDAFGSVVVAIWCALVLVATFSNVRAFFRSDGTARARIAFLSGWLLGTLGLFWYFGDDLLLYSPLWTFHWVMWVVLGLVPLARATDHRAPWFRIGGLTFVAMLALNNAVFVKRMVLQH